MTKRDEWWEDGPYQGPDKPRALGHSLKPIRINTKFNRTKEWWMEKAKLEGDSEVGAGLPPGVLDELYGDSDDLTDQDVEKAIPLPSVDRVIAHIRAQLCPTCQGPVEPVMQHLRIKNRILYWRVALSCAERHPETRLLIRADWVQESS
jgi:hypothetical protein